MMPSSFEPSRPCARMSRFSAMSRNFAGQDRGRTLKSCMEEFFSPGGLLQRLSDSEFRRPELRMALRIRPPATHSILRKAGASDQDRRGGRRGPGLSAAIRNWCSRPSRSFDHLQGISLVVEQAIDAGCVVKDV